MSEIDELRRIAYGRTSSPAQEAAAAEARARLAVLEAPIAPPALAPTDEPGVAPAPTEALDEADESGQPGYLRRLAASRRVWAVPAASAFVLGVLLTVASGLVLFPTVDRSTITPATNTSRRFLEGSGMIDGGALSGNTGAQPQLQQARALLTSSQEAQDVLPIPDEDLVAETTHQLGSTSSNRVFGAISVTGDICLIVVDEAAGSTASTCTSPRDFASRGVWIGMTADGVEVTTTWDGTVVGEMRAPR